jgi:hypothetical protein
MCNAPNPLPVLVRATDEEKERRLAPQAVPVRPPVPVPQPAPAPGGIFDLDTWAKITGLTGGALVLYLVISEGSRLFPPRNLVPVP